MIKRIPTVLVFAFLSIITVLGQDPASEQDAVKQKAERRAKLIESIMVDSNQLKLSENRALVSVKIGAAIWKDEQERATALFKNAVNGLIAAQSVAEANKNSNNHQYYDLLTSQSLRPMIVNTIASADAELALESLYRSRPLAIQRALADGTSNRKIGNQSNNLAEQEINLEQHLLRMMTEQKPERSIAILKDAIKKQLSHETLGLLKKIWEKEPIAGNELANDVADRLISKPFFGSNNQANYELISLSNAILNECVRERSQNEKSVAFDESRMRALAGKLISTYIENGSLVGYLPLQQLELIAKRFNPAVLEPLRKASETNRRHHGFHGNDPEYTKLMNSNPTAETLIAEAKKFPVENRRSIYISAANKLSDGGQYERAMALLNDNFEDDALDNAISSLNGYHAHLLVQRGDFDAAETMMLQFNDINRISGLTSLAMTIYNRDPKENRSRANGILQRVRSLLPEKPETGNEFGQLTQLIQTMTGIEPAEAFRNFEPLVAQINELAEAWAIVNSFQNGNVRQGEYLMSGGFNFGINVDASLFRTLAQKDFKRTMSSIDGLSRREMRILVMMGLLEAGI